MWHTHYLGRSSACFGLFLEDFLVECIGILLVNNNMAKCNLQSEEVFKVVLESDSVSDIDAGNDVSDDKNSDEDDRALHDAAFDVKVDDDGDVQFDATTTGATTMGTGGDKSPNFWVGETSNVLVAPTF